MRSLNRLLHSKREKKDKNSTSKDFRGPSILSMQTTNDNVFPTDYSLFLTSHSLGLEDISLEG